MSNEFKNHCEEAGIVRHYTAPYTPQQNNGVVERRNRTIMKMPRSFLKGKDLLAMFWGEAVRHAVYVLNRLPTRAFTHMKPDIAHIRIFGCLGHMRIPS